MRETNSRMCDFYFEKTTRLCNVISVIFFFPCLLKSVDREVHLLVIRESPTRLEFSPDNSETKFYRNTYVCKNM